MNMLVITGSLISDVNTLRKDATSVGNSLETIPRAVGDKFHDTMEKFLAVYYYCDWFNVSRKRMQISKS
jgi:hypothetical protein